MSITRSVKLLFLLLSALIVIYSFSACKGREKRINLIGSPYFTSDGCLKTDSTIFHYKEKPCSSLKLYVESSGSMNGFFRPNRATQFKEDIWCIFSDFDKFTNEVTAIDGTKEKKFNLQKFRTAMNSGQLNSPNSTMVPDMLHHIIHNLQLNEGEAAVLVSDMKYSPVGNRAIDVLLSQYATDVRNLVMNTQAAFALVVATSNYLDRKGKEVEARSPYYYLIIGKPQQVTWLRNCISTLLNDKGHYVDAVEFGVDYGAPIYELGKVTNGKKKKNEPTIYRVDRKSKSLKGACTIDIELDITAYPWCMENEEVLRKAVELKTTAKSEVSIESVEYEIDNHADQSLKRRAKAIIRVLISKLPKKGDVLEWNVVVPEGIVSTTFQSFMGATSEQILNQSFSIENFINGMSAGKANYYSKTPNRILISTAK